MLKNKKRNHNKIDNVSINTVIAEKLHIVGDMNGDSSIRVDGKITGNISVIPGVILGEKAVVNGNVKSESVVIYGTLNGNIEAKDLSIKSTALINGDISVETLEIDQGGKYNGNLKMEVHKNIQDKGKK